jgi:hypothetical protein
MITFANCACPEPADVRLEHLNRRAPFMQTLQKRDLGQFLNLVSFLEAANLLLQTRNFGFGLFELLELFLKLGLL